MATVASTASLSDHQDSSQEESYADGLDPSNVFVKYLPAELSDSELTTLFSEHGEVISSKIMLDPLTRKSLGYGFVRFAQADDARSAIAAMDGHKISTKRLLCKLANFPKEKETIPEVSAGKATSDDSPRPQPGRPTRPSRTTNDRRAAAGHRPTNTSPTRTSEQLPISTLSSSRSLPGVSRSSSTPNLPSAPSSAKNKPGSLVSSPRRLSTNLYIKSLLPSDTEDTLQQIFGEFGEIEACKVMLDRATGVSRRNGFVRFKTQEQATTAMEAMNGHRREDSVLQVKYADDERQRDMRKRLRLANTPGMISHNSASELNTSNYARIGSIEESAEMMRRAGPPSNTFVPWPYVWPNAAYAPAPPQIIDVAAWLVMYSSAASAAEGYTSPRGMHQMAPPHFYPHHPSMYYHYDHPPPADWNRSYAHTAPLPSSSSGPLWGESPNVPSNGASSAPNS